MDGLRICIGPQVSLVKTVKVTKWRNKRSSDGVEVPSDRAVAIFKGMSSLLWEPNGYCPLCHAGLERFWERSMALTGERSDSHFKQMLTVFEMQITLNLINNYSEKGKKRSKKAKFTRVLNSALRYLHEGGAKPFFREKRNLLVWLSPFIMDFFANISQ